MDKSKESNDDCMGSGTTTTTTTATQPSSERKSYPHCEEQQ